MKKQNINLDFKSIFSEVLNQTTLIVRNSFTLFFMEIQNLIENSLQPLLISGGCSNVTSRCNMSSRLTLTDMRVQYAEKVLKNILAFKEQSSEVILSSNTTVDSKPVLMSTVVVVGPVINPTTKKKDTSTSFEEYVRYLDPMLYYPVGIIC